jgi:hypothetical protein
MKADLTLSDFGPDPGIHHKRVRWVAEPQAPNLVFGMAGPFWLSTYRAERQQV